MIQLTAQDYESVERAESVLVSRGWRNGSLNEHVDRWADLIEDVEAGYAMGVEEYTNDLSVRRWLEEVAPMLSETVRKSLDSRLALLDERFRAATRQPAKPLPGCGKEWWARLPRLLVQELAEDAARMNLTATD